MEFVNSEFYKRKHLDTHIMIAQLRSALLWPILVFCFYVSPFLHFSVPPSGLPSGPLADLPDPLAGLPDPAAGLPDPAAGLPDPAAGLQTPSRPPRPSGGTLGGCQVVWLASQTLRFASQTL